MNFDPITLDEVRRQAEATRADVATLSAAMQSLSVIKKVHQQHIYRDQGFHIN